MVIDKRFLFNKLWFYEIRFETKVVVKIEPVFSVVISDGGTLRLTDSRFSVFY